MFLMRRTVMTKTEEQIIVGIVIQVLQEVTLPERYKVMFHGHTELKPSTYIWWYPVKNITYARLVHEVERWYKDKIKITYGIAGTMEV